MRRSMGSAGKKADRMGARVWPSDLAFFSVLARAGSLSSASLELGITTSAVSKHLANMEARLNATLISRTTRQMRLTPEGKLYLEHASRVAAEIDRLEQALGLAATTAKGLLRVNATLGFGRSQVAPLLSRFVRRHPEIGIQLQLSVNPPTLTDDAFDVCIRFGAPPDSRLVARRLAANRRLLCAAPAYLARHGAPASPEELPSHSCITIRQGDEAYGVWRFATREPQPVTRTVKVTGALSTNDGGIAVAWALDAHGILLRAEWDIESHLKSGRLVQLLADYDTPDADIYAVYPQAHRASQRMRVFIEYLADEFGQRGTRRSE